MRTLLVVAGLVGGGGCSDPNYNVTITRMSITDDLDEFGTPEIEVYLFDANDNLLGCAGTKQGLQYVDNRDVIYDLDAALIDTDNDNNIEIGSDPIRFEVWEDDDEPVCPSYPNPDGNNILGIGPAMTVRSWLEFEGELEFDSVYAFTVRFD